MAMLLCHASLEQFKTCSRDNVFVNKTYEAVWTPQKRRRTHTLFSPGGFVFLTAAQFRRMTVHPSVTFR